MLLSNQKFDCKQYGLVIAQLCLGNLVCYLAPFNKHACVQGMYINLKYCSTLHLAMYSTAVALAKHTSRGDMKIVFAACQLQAVVHSVLLL